MKKNYIKNLILCQLNLIIFCNASVTGWEESIIMPPLRGKERREEGNKLESINEK